MHAWKLSCRFPSGAVSLAAAGRAGSDAPANKNDARQVEVTVVTDQRTVATNSFTERSILEHRTNELVNCHAPRGGA